MEGLFTIILERGMTASILVFAVLLLRLVFKKMPKWFRCVLWGLVAFRLVCPFSFESSFSLVPDVSKISEALETTTAEQEFVWQQIRQNPLPYIWLAGLLMMAFYGVVSYFKVKYKVRGSLNVKENIFYCDNIEIPFVFGLFKAGIYLPSGMDEDIAEDIAELMVESREEIYTLENFRFTFYELWYGSAQGTP